MNRTMGIKNKGSVMSLLFLNKKAAMRWNCASQNAICAALKSLGK